MSCMHACALSWHLPLRLASPAESGMTIILERLCISPTEDIHQGDNPFLQHSHSHSTAQSISHTAHSCKPISPQCTSPCQLPITFLSQAKGSYRTAGKVSSSEHADKDLGDEILRTLCSGAKDTTAVSANDCCRLGTAHVYTAEDVVQLREERERLDRENVAKAKMHQEKAAAKVVSSGEGSKSSNHAQKTIIGAKKVPVIVLSDWEDEEEDMVGGEEWDEEDNGGEENSVVYIGDMLDLEDDMEHVKGREGVNSEPPVVTRSGRVVKMGHLGQ